VARSSITALTEIIALLTNSTVHLPGQINICKPSTWSSRVVATKVEGYPGSDYSLETNFSILDANGSKEHRQCVFAASTQEQDPLSTAGELKCGTGLSVNCDSPVHLEGEPVTYCNPDNKDILTGRNLPNWRMLAQCRW
jgi:hypothetical protein